MKKLLLLLVGFIALVSCNSPKTKEVYKILPIEEWVADYVKKHPNCMNNEITKKQTIDDFIKAVDDSTHKDWMEGIPVELITINKVNDKYVAQFGSYFISNGLSYKAPLEEVNFDIITVVPDSLAPQLKEDELYTLKGIQIVSRIKKSEVADLLLGQESVYGTWDVSLELKDSHITPDLTSNYLAANLGVYYCDVKHINVFTGREKTIVPNK